MWRWRTRTRDHSWGCRQNRANKTNKITTFKLNWGNKISLCHLSLNFPSYSCLPVHLHLSCSLLLQSLVLKSILDKRITLCLKQTKRHMKTTNSQNRIEQQEERLRWKTGEETFMRFSKEVTSCQRASLHWLKLCILWCYRVFLSCPVRNHRVCLWSEFCASFSIHHSRHHHPLFKVKSPGIISLSSKFYLLLRRNILH